MKDLRQGRVNLDDPAATLALLKLDAVLGVKGFFDQATGSVRSASPARSAIRRSTTHCRPASVTASTAGPLAISMSARSSALAPDLSRCATLSGWIKATVRAVLRGWGPGKFDAELVLDGKAFRPDGKSAATLIPPAFGLAGVNLHTWTGWGGDALERIRRQSRDARQGTFYDPGLDDATKFPIAAENGFGHVRSTPDLITSKLPALHFYQLAIPAPRPPQAVSTPPRRVGGKQCSTEKRNAPLATFRRCSPSQVGTCTPPPRSGSTTSRRSARRTNVTGPRHSKGLWTHQKGGFYHDGRFATLSEVIEHYNQFFRLSLAEQEKSDLIEYLKSL